MLSTKSVQRPRQLTRAVWVKFHPLHRRELEDRARERGMRLSQVVRHATQRYEHLTPVEELDDADLD